MKRLLKSVAARHFPEPYVYRKKEGFGMPVASYFRSAAMRPLVEDAIASAGRRGLFDARTMRTWFGQLEDRFVTEAFWVAIAFELWAKQFLDGAHPGRIAA